MPYRPFMPCLSKGATSNSEVLMSFSLYTRWAHDSFRMAHGYVEEARNARPEDREAWINSAREMNRVGIQWLKNARLVIKTEESNDRHRTA
jgi:uncharacterized protein (UPF0262 family)